MTRRCMAVSRKGVVQFRLVILKIIVVIVAIVLLRKKSKP